MHRPSARRAQPAPIDDIAAARAIRSKERRARADPTSTGPSLRQAQLVLVRRGAVVLRRAARQHVEVLDEDVGMAWLMCRTVAGEMLAAQLGNQLALQGRVLGEVVPEARDDLAAATVPANGEGIGPK